MTLENCNEKYLVLLFSNNFHEDLDLNFPRQSPSECSLWTHSYARICWHLSNLHTTWPVGVLVLTLEMHTWQVYGPLFFFFHYNVKLVLLHWPGALFRRWLTLSLGQMVSKSRRQPGSLPSCHSGL